MAGSCEYDSAIKGKVFLAIKDKLIKKHYLMQLTTGLHSEVNFCIINGHFWPHAL
jgi:hypothetical protein